MQKLKKSKSEYSDKVRERIIFAIYRIMMAKGETRSRVAIAERIYTTPAAINRWESLEGHPTTENLVDFCKQFSVSPEWLLLGNGQMFGNAELVTRIEFLESRVMELEKVAGIKTHKRKLPKDEN